MVLQELLEHQYPVLYLTLGFDLEVADSFGVVELEVMALELMG